MGPRSAEAYVLRNRGLTYGQIARKMKIHPGSVAALLVRAKRSIDGTIKPVGQPIIFDFERHPTRCKCGLILPCECLPGIYEVASGRRGESTGMSDE